MASALRDRIMGRDRSDSVEDSGKNYRLLMSAGPNYDKTQQRLLSPNSPSAHHISHAASVSVRIKNYTGLPSSSPRSSEGYFSQPAHAKDTFSVAFAFTPPYDINAADLYFGLDTGHNPIRKFGIPKSLVNTAFKIAREFIDPSLECDAGIDEPWIRGPVVAGSTTTMCVGDLVQTSTGPEAQGQSQGQGGGGFPAPEVLIEGATSADATTFRAEQGIPDDAGKRRKLFNNETNRRKLILQKGRTYYFDFANGYIDWSAYALKLPGFSVGVLKYLGKGQPPGGPRSASTSRTPSPLGEDQGGDNAQQQQQQQQSQAPEQHDTTTAPTGGDGKSTSGSKSPSHKVRFFLKDINTEEVFFVIMCTLLTGEDLRVALEDDARREEDARRSERDTVQEGSAQPPVTQPGATQAPAAQSVAAQSAVAQSP